MDLKSISEVAWRQVFPNPSDEAAVQLEEFIETAKGEYAYQMLLMYWKEKREDGSFNIPSNLLTTVKKEVVDGVADISDLEVFRGIPNDFWLQNVGGIGSKCQYIKTNVNHAQVLSDDDSLPENVKRYYPAGKEICFPDGVHENPVPITYANMGENVDGSIEIDDTIAAIVRSRLIEIYLGKENKEDVTNNSNSNE